MWRYLTRRVLHAVIVILGVSIFTFLLTRIVGNPVQLILGRAPASAASAKQLAHSLGLDQPLWKQYLDWLGKAVRGDLGQSYTSPITVMAQLRSAAPVTLELTILALVLALVVGVTAGIISAVKRGKAIDNGLATLSSAAIAMPNFWLGLILIYLLADKAGILPANGYTPFTTDPIENLKSMVLPVLTLAAFYTGSYTRYMRSLVLTGLGEDHVRAARAKGVPSRVLMSHHVLRNAMVPFVTVVGLDVAGLLGGAVVTEVVFSLPGVGSLLENSILNGNVPMVEGTVLVITVGVVVLNLILDIAYGYLNPQIRFGTV